MNNPEPAIKHLFILNPRSFSHKWKMRNLLLKINNYFKSQENRHNKKDYKIVISQFPRDAVGIIHFFARSHPKGTRIRVYAAGGDGILFDCLNGVMGIENADLAALPYGHTNSFLQGFGRQKMPLFQDLSLQCSAPAIPLDVIKSGNIYALSFCTIGVTSLAILKAQQIRDKLEAGGSISRWLSNRFYPQIYLVGAVPAFFDKDMLQQQYEVQVDDEDLGGNYRGILMANGAYYGGVRHPARNARPDDGLLDIIFARSGKPLRSLALVPQYMKGHHHKFPGEYMLRRARKISISSRQPILINFDEVVFHDTSITVEVLSRAVRFVDPTLQGYQGVPNE